MKTLKMYSLKRESKFEIFFFKYQHLCNMEIYFKRDVLLILSKPNNTDRAKIGLHRFRKKKGKRILKS